MNSKWTKERLIDATWGDLAGIVVVCFTISLALDGFGVGTDSTDRDGFHRSGVKLVIDAGTGLQYLAVHGGGITPRLDANGHQMREN